jgi:hypothetical protein
MWGEAGGAEEYKPWFTPIHLTASLAKANALQQLAGRKVLMYCKGGTAVYRQRMWGETGGGEEYRSWLTPIQRPAGLAGSQCTPTAGGTDGTDVLHRRRPV